MSDPGLPDDLADLERRLGADPLPTSAVAF
jgi:hypothetical protein